MILRFDMIKDLFHEFFTEFLLIQGTILQLPQEITHAGGIHDQNACVRQNSLPGSAQPRYFLFQLPLIIFGNE